jgi:hypothetical protein
MFVQLGMTDDGYVMEDSENMSYRQFVNSFLPYHPTDLKLTRLILKIDQDDIMWDKLLELDLFNSTKIVGLKKRLLNIRKKILSDNWTLEPDDKDMIVMYHKFGYELDGAKSKSILRWYALEKIRPILQWQKQLVYRLRWQPAYLERENYHAWSTTSYS